MLPEQFLIRMKEILGEEYQDFLAGFEKPVSLSLRVNGLKGSGEKLKEKLGDCLVPVPWNSKGYYYKEDLRPGKHPYHEAGAYYIQEASAMLPAVYLDAKPGEAVLDLCAAPGGKSTQIADSMQGKGLLICNEIHPGRAKILSENIERMGICNALVLNHTPLELAKRFPESFDKILVDAPCSGEGMFRKNEEAAAQWSLENVRMCAERQRDILDCAASMLKPGGRIVYSTCTFSPDEDEDTVRGFLGSHSEFSLEEIRDHSGPESGCGIMPGMKGLEKAVRLWPHKLNGEGHFVAALKKCGESGELIRYGREKGISEKECTLWLEFREKYLKKTFVGTYINFGSQLFLLTESAPSLKGLKTLRPGLHLGTIKKNRFEPAHALALALRTEDAAYWLDLSVEEAEKYLAGQVLDVQNTHVQNRNIQTFGAWGEKGWYLITVDGYSLGWGKLSGGIMKNHYPKGLRK